MSSNVYYWDYDKTIWENIVAVMFEQLLVRQLVIVVDKEKVKK